MSGAPGHRHSVSRGLRARAGRRGQRERSPGGPRRPGATDALTVWVVKPVSQCVLHVCAGRCVHGASLLKPREQREHGDSKRRRHHCHLGKLSEILWGRTKGHLQRGCAPYLLSADDVPLTCWALGTRRPGGHPPSAVEEAGTRQHNGMRAPRHRVCGPCSLTSFASLKLDFS